jgi:DNA-directed RNA polymerase subunit F
MVAPLHDKEGFFKYYTAESTKLTLTTGARKWSTPALFNDPFDNQFDLKFEEPSVGLARTHVGQFLELMTAGQPIGRDQFGDLAPVMEYLRQIHIQNPGLRYSEADLAELVEGATEGMENVVKTLPQANSEVRAILADTSIFCLSETCDNLLMWSHYAHNHSGAVIYFLSLQEVDSPLTLAEPVRYLREFPRLEFASLMNGEDMRKRVYETVTLSKSEVWSYEREWRVVTSLREKTKPYEIIPFAREEVGAVYLGCRMDEGDRNEIVDIVRSRYSDAKLFQAKNNAHNFSLIFEQIG